MNRVKCKNAVFGLLFACWCAIVPACGKSGIGGIDMFGQRQGEPWTIECLELQGEGAEQNVEEIAAALRNTRGLDPLQVRVETKPDRAWVYYGTYYRDIDVHSGKRSIPGQMTRDIRRIKELGDTAGRRYFMAARAVPMPKPDVGPAEWDLRNVQGKYTLQVATYFDTSRMPDRKQAAVEKVRQLRDKGLEAYYYHGARHSVVTVGVFGEGAVLDRSGQVRYIDYGDDRRQVAYRYSSDVVALQQREECKYNLTNDDIWYNLDDKGRRVPVRSTLVRIPSAEDGGQL